MKTFHPVTKIGVPLVVALLGLLLGHPPASAVTFTVTPSSVGNLYAGSVTLQVTGLNTGETVLVEKFLDANTNGVIDAGDWLVQSFQLTDGQASVIGGVTNVNVPGDLNPTPGAIAAQLNIQTRGIVQQIVGQYLFVVSSPTNRFASITNLFTVTRSVSAQSVTGAVLCSGAKIPNVLVLVAPPRTGNGGSSPVDGAVADDSGNYSISAAPGTYTFYAVKSNYVFDTSAAPWVALGAGAMVSTNLNLLPATCSISGKIVDTNNPSLGLPGIFFTAKSTNNLLAAGFTDANGNFTLPVTASLWSIDLSSGFPEALGYLGFQNDPQVDTTSGSVTGVTIALPKGTALFYGTVTTNGQSLAGVSLYADDNNNYEAETITDTNGYYVMPVLAEQWYVSPDTSSGVLTNYLFAAADTNIVDGQALRLDFAGIVATNLITGFVTDIYSNPVANVNVYANSTNGVYSQSTDTDTNGYYSLNVGSGTWSVGVCCEGWSDCLNALGYECISNLIVNILNNNATVNFVVQPLPSSGSAGVLFYDNFEQFPNGTVLTETNYTPLVGQWAEISTNDVKPGETYATVVASNLLGGIRAFFNLATVPYRQSYQGTPTIAATNPVVTLNWKLWIDAVKSPSTTIGGVMSDVTVTDLIVNGSTTNCDYNVLIFFNDGGQVFAFTNEHSLSALVPIGSWAGLAGTVMTNQLVLNYPAQTYQFSINGNVLTNMPLPGFITNFLDGAYMEISETSTGGWGYTASTGNQFALDDIEISTSTNGAVQTVCDYISAVKVLPYVQTNAGPPSLSTTGFVFVSWAWPMSSNSVNSATLQIPGGSVFPLSQFPSGAFFLYQTFPSQAARDAAFPDGDYTMVIVTAQGTYVSTMALTGDTYPSPLQILNWSAAQSINPATNFVFNWSSTGGTTNDYLQFTLFDAGGNIVFDTGGGFDSANCQPLNGTTTSVTVPAGTLATNATYAATLSFGMMAASDTNSVPGAVGVVGYGALTTFTLNTTYADSVGDGIPDWWRAQYFPNQPAGNQNGTMTNHLSCATCDADGTGQDNAFKYIAGLNPTNRSSVFTLSVASVTNAPREFNLIFSPVVAGRTYTPQFCTNLVGATWAALTGFSGPTTNPILNQVTITDLNATNAQKFYRIDISLGTNPPPAPVTFTITPSTVNNQYTGLITLLVTGLTNGETVLVQKYRDSNADGIVDAGDRLIQQFNLTDGQAGMVIGGVTNVNVPGDTDTIPGQITAQLNFQTLNVVEPMVEHCLFVLSSPTGRFAPLTNQFTSTDAVSAQTFTGAVLCSGVPISNAVVYTFLPGTAVAVAGTVADNSGNYSIGAAPGTYALYAFKSNYVCNLWAPLVLTLGAGATVITNLNLLPATCTLSGSVVDTNNPSLGLPGMSMLAVSTNGLGVLGFTVANGNFTLPVTPSLWSVSVQSYSFVDLGYLGLQNWPWVDTTGGSASGVIIALPKATALLYGTVQDAQNHPLPGVDLSGNDCSGLCLYQGGARTDTNGYYVMAVNADAWSAYPGADFPSYSNYVFSQMSDTNVSAGQAVLENFVGIVATNHIAGHVENVAGNPLATVGVNASATISSNNFSRWVSTDGTGYYSISVGNATWTVGICCSSCDPNLDLTAAGYQCANSTLVAVSNNDAVVNFTLQPASFQAWQTIYFGSTNNPNAAAAFDADGTGQNNQFKYVAGLDPTNPASVFRLRIADVPGISSQKNIIYSPVVTGRTYTVQFTTNLVGSAYTNLTGFSGPQNSGTQATVTDLNATQSNKFYRLNISLP
jgi:hypothetical protein